MLDDSQKSGSVYLINGFGSMNLNLTDPTSGSGSTTLLLGYMRVFYQ
jgi:hypothetical protein